jgi:PAS domain S-box-containing protein
MKDIFRNLYNCAPVGFYQANRDGRILRANDGMARILGYKDVDDLLISATMKDFYLNPGDREMLFKEYEESGGNIPNSIEICWKKKNGEAIWILHHALTTIDDDGHILFCEGSIIDITDRKQAEYHIHVQHELGIALSATSNLNEALDLVLDTICDMKAADCGGIYVYNKEQNVLDLIVHKGLSPRFINHTKEYSPDSINFKMLHMGVSIHRRHSDLHLLNHSYVIEEGIRSFLVVPIRYEDSVLASINIASKSVLEFSPKTIQFIETIATHVSGTIIRIKSENALKENKEELQLIFDSFDDIMTIVDENLLIIKMNLAGLKILGYTKEEISGMSILELHAVEHRSEAKTTIGKLITGDSKTCTLPLITKNNQLIAVETSILTSSIGNKKVIIGRSIIIDPQAN